MDEHIISILGWVGSVVGAGIVAWIGWILKNKFTQVENHESRIGRLEDSNVTADQLPTTSQIDSRFIGRQRVFTSVAEMEAATPLYVGEAVFLSDGWRSGMFIAKYGSNFDVNAEQPAIATDATIASHFIV